MSVALASKDLREAAYSDAVWEPKWRLRWPNLPVPRGACLAREAFLQRQQSTATLAFSDFHSARCDLAQPQEDAEERHEAGGTRGRERGAQTAPVDKLISLDNMHHDVMPQSYLFAAVQVCCSYNTSWPENKVNSVGAQYRIQHYPLSQHLSFPVPAFLACIPYLASSQTTYLIHFMAFMPAGRGVSVPILRALPLAPLETMMFHTSSPWEISCRGLTSLFGGLCGWASCIGVICTLAIAAG